MKRFRDTKLWGKAWHRRWPLRIKLLWQYINDNCDHAGVWDPDWELASLQIGEPVGIEDLDTLSDGNDPTDGPRVEVLPNGKVWSSGFIGFQYGRLSAECKAHNPVITSIQKNSLSKRLYECLPIRDKDKDKDKDSPGEGKGGAGGKGKPRPRNPLMDALALLDATDLAEVTPAGWKRVAKALQEIKLATPGVTPDEIKRRAANYHAQFDGATLTSTALAKHWARMKDGKNPSSPAPARDRYDRDDDPFFLKTPKPGGAQ